MLQGHTIACTIPKEYHRGALGEQRLSLLDQRDMEVFRKVSLLALAHQLGERQGAAFIDHVEHQRDIPTSYDAAVDDQHQRL